MFDLVHICPITEDSSGTDGGADATSGSRSSSSGKAADSSEGGRVDAPESGPSPAVSVPKTGRERAEKNSYSPSEDAKLWTLFGSYSSHTGMSGM